MTSENQVGRLVVKDDGNNISGILTFGRIIRTNDNKQETSDVVERATGKLLKFQKIRKKLPLCEFSHRTMEENTLLLK
ncbi:hypothetical protein ABF87_02610 [Nitrosomonas sp. JL21]|nr:hypothetical protein [Nitrosomonas sp. JL21]